MDAQREWELLGNEGEAPELASRKPQLRLAELDLGGSRSWAEKSRTGFEKDGSKGSL